MGCYCCKPLIDFFYGPVPKQKLSPRAVTTEISVQGQNVQGQNVQEQNVPNETAISPPTDKTVQENTCTEISLSVTDDIGDTDIVVELDTDWYKIDRV